MLRTPRRTRDTDAPSSRSFFLMLVLRPFHSVIFRVAVDPLTVAAQRIFDSVGSHTFSPPAPEPPAPSRFHPFRITAQTYGNALAPPAAFTGLASLATKRADAGEMGTLSR
jgi:hypothetical protein